jgi:hypothetical protein
MFCVSSYIHGDVMMRNIEVISDKYNAVVICCSGNYGQICRYVGNY